MAAFMKLGDIKGEFAPSRQVEDNGDQVAQFTTGGGGDSVHQSPGTCDPGPGVLHWDVICDVGTSIKQTSVADALTDYRLTGIETGSGDDHIIHCLLYTSPSPRDATLSRMPSSA